MVASTAPDSVGELIFTKLIASNQSRPFVLAVVIECLVITCNKCICDVCSECKGKDTTPELGPRSLTDPKIPAVGRRMAHLEVPKLTHPTLSILFVESRVEVWHVL